MCIRVNRHTATRLGRLPGLGVLLGSLSDISGWFRVLRTDKKRQFGNKSHVVVSVSFRTRGMILSKALQLEGVGGPDDSS